MEQKQIELVVRTREGHGKSAARKIRNNKQIPGIVYGKNNNELNVISLALDKTEFSKLIASQESEHLILSIIIKDNANSVISKKIVIIKDIQKDAISEEIIHVDFQQIAIDKKLRTRIPIVLQGKPSGVKEGGVLEHLLHELEVECLPLDIINHIVVDVNNLKLGDSIHVKDLPPQDKIKVLSNGETTIAVVSAVHKEEEKAVAKEAQPAATEPEIVGKKGKAETEEAAPAAKEKEAAPKAGTK